MTAHVDAALAAAKEAGPVAVRVWCAHCGDGGRPIAVVRRSSAGLVFDGEGYNLTDPDYHRVIQDRQREIAGKRIRPVNRGRHLILLERLPDPDADLPPHAGCAVHGEATFEVENLIAVAKAAKFKPANMKVSPVPPEPSTA